MNSNDSFTKNFNEVIKEKNKIKKMPKKVNFNYLQIKTAEQIAHLILKCQDTLDHEFVYLYKFKYIFEKCIQYKTLRDKEELQDFSLYEDSKNEHTEEEKRQVVESD